MYVRSVHRYDQGQGWSLVPSRLGLLEDTHLLVKGTTDLFECSGRLLVWVFLTSGNVRPTRILSFSTLKRHGTPQYIPVA